MLQYPNTFLHSITHESIISNAFSGKPRHCPQKVNTKSPKFQLIHKLTPLDGERSHLYRIYYLDEHISYTVTAKSGSSNSDPPLPLTILPLCSRFEFSL